MSTDWSPAGESAALLWYERSVLAGLFVGAIGFGVHATLFFLCFNLLWSRRGYPSERFFIAYITIVFILSNIGNATNIKFGQMVFIDNRDYPGGPGAYFVEQSTNIVEVLCNSVYIVLSWFQDGLLLYRFWVIYGRVRYTIVLPALMVLSSTILSMFLIAMLSRPDTTLWSNISFKLAISYWSISISFNVLVTLLITGRLLFIRWRTRRLFLGFDTPYLTVSAMLIESTFIYSSTGFVFLISFALNSPVQNLALPLLGQVQSIAPLLIILRVAQGKAWSPATAENLQSDIQFRQKGSSKARQESTTILAPVSLKQKRSSLELQAIHSKDLDLEIAVSELQVASKP